MYFGIKLIKLTFSGGMRMQDGRADKITPFVSTLDKAFANGFLKELFYSALGCRMTQSPTSNSANTKWFTL